MNGCETTGAKTARTTRPRPMAASRWRWFRRFGIRLIMIEGLPRGQGLERAPHHEELRLPDPNLVQVAEPLRRVVAEPAAVDPRAVQAAQVLDRADGPVEAQEAVALADLLVVHVDVGRLAAPHD